MYKSKIQKSNFKTDLSNQVQNQQWKKIENPSSISQNSVQQQTSSTTQDETAGWKTYKNDQYGFELKYPEYLVSGAGFNKSTTFNAATSTNQLIEQYGANGEDLGQVSLAFIIEELDINISKSSQTFDELWQKYLKDSQVDDIGSPSGLKKISGLNGLTYEAVGGDAAYFYSEILKDNTKIELNYTCSGGINSKCSNRRDQILSTFKFIK